jgi:MFS family permease
MFLFSRWSGGLVEKFGARRPLIVGPAIAAGGFVLFALPGIGGGYWTTFFPATVVLGIGMTISVAPLTTTVMGAVEQRHAGIASGINNAVSRSAGLLAVAALGVILLSVFSRGLDRRLAGLDLPTATRHALESDRNRLVALEAPASADAGTRKRVDEAVDESFVAGYRVTMLTAAGLALLASASAAWLIREK